MRRLKRGLKPLSNFKRNLTALSSWYSIYTSAIAFIPELTQKLYVGLWLAFISSCLLPFKLLGFFIGVYAGIKFFVIDFLFKSCPKLRQRFDTPFIIWTHLPTDLQLKERGGSTLTRRLSESEQLLVVFVTVSLSDPLKCSCSSVGPAAPLGASRDEDGGRYSSTKRGAFHEVFNLQESERPLTVCESGWRCCLINRDRKSPTDYIRNGYLYVTENHLCFESSSSRSGSSKRNKVIKLADITDIQKYKVLSVLPGSGSGISIATPSTTKASHASFSAALHDDSRTDLNEVKGVYAGIKFFIIDFLFKSCPKLRQRFDTRVHHLDPPAHRPAAEGARRLHAHQEVCESGWRCCLINRDRKSPTDYIRNGYLYVTENHLCFESSSSRSGSSKRNKVIKLATSPTSRRFVPTTCCYKVLSVLPGSGSGISIATPSTTKASHASFSAALHDDSRTDLNEVKGHLEIALLEKHFLGE
ncbi:hypothetical protein KUCAC02_024752 [Chaenocephalus aceratus]|nr:hypothetical protein KUCAC02_024752 [Chaenocephalus aceratus]